MDRSKYDIVLFTLFRTDHEYSSVSLSWAKEFAKNNRVFYINHPYSVKDFLKGLSSDKKLQKRATQLLTNQIAYEKIKEIPENFISVQPTLSLPINWLSPGNLYNSLANWNNKIVLKAVKKVLKDYDIKDFIYMNCYDPYFAGHLPKEFGQTLSIYQCIDDISQDPYSIKHGERLEQEAIAKSDFGLVTGTQLKRILQPHNPETHIAHNAVDISIFEKTLSADFERPDEIKDVTTPIIGFTGNMDYLRMDYPLIKKVAEKHSDKTVVLVGPINSDEFYELGIDKLPNVITTGRKSIYDLPKYLKFMDVTMIPFLCNTLTKSIYPLKINEYLAAGSAVISTSFSEDIKGFKEVIYLAENHDEFLNLIDKAIGENSPELQQKRFKVAQTNTWEARVEQFWQLAENHLTKTGKIAPKTSTKINGTV